ncbi:serine hydrolase domain-containing protein [Paenibacillus sp. MMS18-CY102]|uniref:serine hydrolase domain-containing protein n=1 Tax=Paenibacillus sp. MMS18-CY102 TaxID=2682849 RepID=UPI0013656E30|nr:serine hydrolase [Paenibacillus sp. MMS18-CY102]MWC27935.1 serine hydrolase [Paenibacillus sp. MMS18-CY102]
MSNMTRMRMHMAVSEDPNLPRRSVQEAGVDGEKLTVMAAKLPSWGMKSIVLVQAGALVWEWHDTGEDRPLSLYSCTKSVLSMLMGIAIGQGQLKGTDERVADWLEPFGRKGVDERLAAIELSHLLTMTSGIDWPDFDKPYRAMRTSADWVQFVADRSIHQPPGRAFCYNSGGSHLLSAVLTKATGQSALSYASEHLFSPLGIQRAAWSSNRDINEGGTGLHLSARDMAKLGLLYLHGGTWEGKTIVPSEWVRTSTRAHHKALVHYEPHIYGQYGDHWWVSDGDEESGPFYFAFGYGGQYLIVAPELDAVVVIRKAPTGRNQAIVSRELFHQWIVPILQRRRAKP